MRVKESVKVYHIPNSAEGIDMKDREGVIVDDASKQEVHTHTLVIFCQGARLVKRELSLAYLCFG